MPRDDPDPELLPRVTRVVSQVILRTTGRSVRPGPDDPLFENGPLDPVELPLLVLALQDELGVILEPHQASPRALRTISSIVRSQARSFRRD